MMEKAREERQRFLSREAKNEEDEKNTEKEVAEGSVRGNVNKRNSKQ